jgi:hypothetical protein
VAHSAFGETENYPIAWTEINCHNGEPVPFSGHQTFGVTTTLTGGFHVLISTHTTADGTGDFGNVYHGVSDDSFELNDPNTLGFEQTNVHNVTLKSPTAPDMRIKLVEHVTVSANGQWTASVEKGSIDCTEP